MPCRRCYTFRSYFTIPYLFLCPHGTNPWAGTKNILLSSACGMVGICQLFLCGVVRWLLSFQKRTVPQYFEPCQCRSRLFARNPDPDYRQSLGQTLLGRMVDMGPKIDHCPYFMVYFCVLSYCQKHAHA